MFPYFTSRLNRRFIINGRTQRVVVRPYQHRILVHCRRATADIRRQLHVGTLFTITGKRERVGNQRSRHHRLQCQANSDATCRRVNTNGNRIGPLRVFDRIVVTLAYQVKTSSDGRVDLRQLTSRATRLVTFTASNRVGSLDVNRRVDNKQNGNSVRTLHTRKASNSRGREAI